MYLTNGPQIKKLMKDEELPALLFNLKEAEAWIAMCTLTTDFLGNHRTNDYIEEVQEMLDAFKNNL